MKKQQIPLGRRNFIKKSSLVTLGVGSLVSFRSQSEAAPYSTEDSIHIIGPKEGFTPQIGTLVSMMNWMRNIILRPVAGLTIDELDYIHDKNSNSIGAMLLHLAATERFYQIHTFEGKNWGDWSKEDTEKWSTAMGLGDKGRKKIKGEPLDFYTTKLKQVRTHTLNEFAKRDDQWLMTIDKNWGWGPTNNYCKWFHVCEHESNHNGQIKWLKNRLPSS